MRRRIALLLAAALTALACDSVEQIAGPSPDEIAAEFVDSWNADDYETMHDLLVPAEKVREKWHSGAMRYYVERFLRRGGVRDFEVVLGEGRDGSETDPAPGGYIADYTITYDSRASSEPITLEGALSLFETEGEWWVEWKPARLLLPGQQKARTWRIEYDWLRRGTIRDRDGKMLATGHEEDRRYPMGSVAGTTIGHLEPAPEKGPIEGRLVGASGLERDFDTHLAGKPTSRLVLVDASGNAYETLGSKRGKRGEDLKVALDTDVQRAAEAAFGGTVGGAVVLDPNNGDILAAVASSAFDPGNYVGAADVEPFNRALSGLYPPGSSLKVLTASAALDTGEVTPSTTLTGPKEYRGVRNFESGEFGTISFASALQNSVNTSFAQVALRLGPKRLHRYAERFGFNRAPKMDLNAATSSFPMPLDEGDLMWGSIGQAQVLATPLQMATVAGTVANDGRRMEPRIDLGVKPRGTRAIKPKTARTMQELMRSVVTGGTGVAANVSGLEVAGKTGTAEVDVAGERKNHAWFICFAPASNPRVAVAVVAEYGGVGGQVAAPLARSILTSVWPKLP